VADQPVITPTKAMMRGHFQQAGEAREALLRADVEGAKKAMNWLASHHLGAALPEDLQPMQKAMQDSAAEFGKATNLREAGVALALTLTKCGDCHEKAGKGPTFAVPPLPEGDDIVHHMQRHHWAAQRMWEGLVRSDSQAFEAAAAAMAEGPACGTLLTPPPEFKESVEQLTKHVHALGEKAKAAADPAARAEVYGNFLATCATCHRMLGRGPAPVAATN
jgi:cytochrome c553